MERTIQINNTSYQITDREYVLSGTEGAVYQVKEDCVKILFDDTLNDKMKINKILALCDKSDYLSNISGFEDIAIPLFPAYEKEKFCGFSMAFFKDSTPINSIRYDIFTKNYNVANLSDDKALKIIQQLFGLLQILHKQRIIIGDLNSDNILINKDTFHTYLVDIDSTQVGEFYCTVTKEEYCCPIVEQIGPNSNNAYTYSTSSDIFALSIICFEFFIGVHPFDSGTSPVLDLSEAKKLGVNYMTFHFNKTRKEKGYELIDKENYDLVFKRLDQLKKNYSSIYKHFLDVFHFNKRNYYEKRSIQKTVRKQRNRTVKPIRGYTPAKSRKDPVEFNLFVQQYNLELI